MKRICFTWTEVWYDFDNREEAEIFIRKNTGKRWMIMDTEYHPHFLGDYVSPDKINYYITEDKDFSYVLYTVRVRKPIKGYYPGW